MTADLIAVRQHLADLAARHGWGTRLPHPGRWWMLLELHHPQHECRIVIRWMNDLCNATLMDYPTSATWQLADCTPTELEWAIVAPETIGQTIDCVHGLPDIIDLRDPR